MAEVNVANATSLWKALCMKKSPPTWQTVTTEFTDASVMAAIGSRARGGGVTGFKSEKNMLWKARVRRRSQSMSSLVTSASQLAPVTCDEADVPDASAHPGDSFFFRFSRLCCRTSPEIPTTTSATSQTFSASSCASISPERDPFESPVQSPAALVLGMSRMTATLSCDSGCCDTGPGSETLSPPPELDDLELRHSSRPRFRMTPSVIISDFSFEEEQSPDSKEASEEKYSERAQSSWYDRGGGAGIIRRDSLGLPGLAGLTLEDVENDRAARRLSDCSTCSSVSTLDVDCPSPGVTRSFFEAGPGLGIGIDIRTVTGLSNAHEELSIDEDAGIELREEEEEHALGEAEGEMNATLIESNTTLPVEITEADVTLTINTSHGGTAHDEDTQLATIDANAEAGDSQDGNSRRKETDQGIPPRVSKKVSGWKKVRNVVQWTPFIQTYRRPRYPWVQLSGHQGNFKTCKEQGTILKKLCSKEEKCFQDLMEDPLKSFVPHYRGQVTADDGEKFLALEDLLSAFVNPCVMDCKLGIRTYLEEEIAKSKDKPKLRKDMYEKMVTLDANAPTAEEHRLQGVTKPRYMLWRETLSSTATFGFRIEGIRKSDGSSSNDFKTTRTAKQLSEAFQDFLQGFPHAPEMYLERLQELNETLQSSPFFAAHELIGSSLLFVHDATHANVWMIDFAKTLPLPDGITIDHKKPWQFGNHEDGYLTGLHNIITLFEQINQES